PAWIRLMLDTFLKRAVGRLTGHVDAAPGDVVLPAVIDTAETVLFVAPVEQRRAPMGTERSEQADSSARVSEGNEVFAEQANAHRRGVRPRELLREQRRQPEPSEELAHRFPGANASEQLILFG